ncbi:MAG: HNH endonuclease [Actinomycetota bacterium]|nr:HNH endonuclease [Actinomycetota bacterium]
MTATTLPVLHPVERAVESVASSFADVADVRLWSLTDAELRALLPRLAGLTAQLAALQARVQAQAEVRDVGAVDGAISTANWLAHTTRQTHGEAHRQLRLAADLELRPATASALAAGELVVEQARVILDAVTAVEQIPDDLASARGLDRASLAGSAEARLLADAAHHDAKDLRVLGRRILDVVAPEVAEEHERRLLEAEERRAQEHTRLTMGDDGQGLVHGRFTIPSLQGAMLRKALLAFAAPKHQAAVGGLMRRPSPERMGAAFCELVERYPTDRLPTAGGVAATVVVTIALDRLLQELGAASLDDDGRISATLARRLACETGLLPAVLSGAGMPLDVGRKRRFHTEPQRAALALRDGGCTAEGCDWPPGLCHAHHDHPWSAGGGTSVDNGRLLCPKHHALAHDPGYASTALGTGKLRFTRRT